MTKGINSLLQNYVKLLFLDNEFFKLKQKLDKHKEYINKYNQLSKKVEEKKLLQKEIEELETRRKKRNPALRWPVC